ncbi:HAAS signaling domain-containing protein [Dethiothermospora halolimnae]|uniref:HAAS signaling domain-containing protein n=1 Tax=Dethiothermospora halolimnae TaxID=3114390 RepID=UPI003CCC4088
MNKEKFLQSLSKELKDISKEEREDVLFDYREHFDIGLKDGRSEEEISKSLGNPKKIAKQIKVSSILEEASNNTSTRNIFKAILAVMGLSLLNLMIVGPLLLSFGAVILALIASSVAVVLAGGLAIISTILEPILKNIVSMSVNPFIGIVGGVGTTALGILSTIGSIYLAKWFFKGTVKYLNTNLDIISNRRGKSE